MAFSQPPEESKRKINKAGEVLIANSTSPNELIWARDVADRWRACHAYPINTFQATLRIKLKNYPSNPIVAQRLKRMSTIIDKLKRYPAMQLTTMQDIGGIRAVLASIADVNKLATDYRSNRRLAHELIDEKDYIKDPRSADGYRSIHLIYKYKNKHVPSYDGLRLELQIRTKLQHIWATAVETMGTFLGQALKSRQGDQEWLDFFTIVSSAFAYMEKCSPIPRFKYLSRQATYSAVADAEACLGALDKMNGFSVAVNEIVKRRKLGKSTTYHLIILNSLDRTVQIRAYDRRNFKRAIYDYSNVEAEVAKGKKIEPVLVSAGPIDTLRRAYPNFFLDIGGFVKIVNGICTQARKPK